MKINKLLKVQVKNNHKVKKIVEHSGKSTEKSVFVMHKENDNYLKEALNLGATTIITNKKIEVPEKINNIVVQNTYKTLGRILKKCYFRVLSKYKIIGVTGTNGKTSTTTLIYNYLKTIKKDCVLVGSNGIFYDDVKINIKNTTPCLTDIYDAVLEHDKSHVSKERYLILECSSQGIRNNRLSGISFDAIGFTNITEDHLDYHLNRSDYVFSKALLFNQLKNEAKVIIDSNNCYYELLSSICPVDTISYGINGNYVYTIKESTPEGSKFIIKTKEKLYNMESKLLGDFQVENMTLAFTILNELKIELNDYTHFLEEFTEVPGRLNKYVFKNITIYIDYAHTISAVERVLENLKKENKRIFSVIGCGGDRDKSKRPIIGEIVSNNSFFTVFTEDNNRNEKFENIINDILKGVNSSNYEVIQNRYEAIKFILSKVKIDDIVVIFGKGIEKTKTIYGDLTDIEMVKVILND